MTGSGKHLRTGYYSAVVIGGSAGSAEVLDIVLALLPANFPLPVLIVRHLHPSEDGRFARHLSGVTGLSVSEPCDKQPIKNGTVYVAPANYHMLVEKDQTIALSVHGRFNWSRPSIDVLFESAARAWNAPVIAILLSGASSDGANGMAAINVAGGLTIAQEPKDAEFPLMPQSAIDMNVVDFVYATAQIGPLLVGVGANNRQYLSHRVQQ